MNLNSLSKMPFRVIFGSVNSRLVFGSETLSFPLQNLNFSAISRPKDHSNQIGSCLPAPSVILLTHLSCG